MSKPLKEQILEEITSIVLGELFSGAYKSTHVEENVGESTNLRSPAL